MTTATVMLICGYPDGDEAWATGPMTPEEAARVIAHVEQRGHCSGPHWTRPTEEENHDD